MPDTRARQVLLVGSVPLESSSAVFEAVAGSLGGLAKRIPDGETKERKDWIVWQADVMKHAKGLEPGGSRELQGGYHFTLYKVKNGGAADVEIGPLGYAAAALKSYEDFNGLRAQGKIAAGTRFQVSLPTPIAVVMSFCEPEAIGPVWPKYEERIKSGGRRNYSRNPTSGPRHSMGYCRRNLLRPGSSGDGKGHPNGGAGSFHRPDQRTYPRGR